MRPACCVLRGNGAAGWVASLVFVVGVEIPAQEIEVATDHATVALRLDSGNVAFIVRDAAGAVVHTAVFPELNVDGFAQRGFVRAAGEPANGAVAAGNGSVRVVLEPVSERAVAVTWTTVDGRARELELHLRSDDETAYYGTGERFNALNQRGYILPVVTDDRYGNKGVGTHKPIPFFMSTRGFGVWVDGYTPSTFDLSGTERFASRLRLVDSTLRVVLIAGPSLAEVLDGFTALTGRPRVPPPWAFGLWKSRDVHHNRDSVMVDIQRLRRERIPASVLVLDSPWETGYNDFIVNPVQFEDPASMFERIEALGFQLCLWLTPFVNVRNVIDMRGIDTVTSTWEEAVRRGVLVTDDEGEVALSEWWKGVGGLVDFTDPAATAWWLGQLAKTKAYGARAFKADDGEGNFVPNAVFHDGSSAQEMKNRYAVLYNDAVQRHIDTELGGDGVLITRSGFTGTQRVPFAWAGDNRGDFSFGDGLPSVIIAGQSAALSGIPLWGSDIAGYAGRPTKEVFIRWTQYGAFTPFMQVHMTSNWGPWDFDEETLDIFRDYARLRTQLFPYLYDAAHEASRTGMPIIRPMVLAFTEEGAAHAQVYQYLFGPDLLVAPMYQPGTARAVYLPRGTWTDYWSGARLDGGRLLEVEAPLDRLPLFVRDDAILVRLPEDVETLVARHARMDPRVVAVDERRIVEIWPGEEGAVRTWDGVAATVDRDDARTRLRLSSQTPRPITVRVVHRRIDRVAAPGGTVRRDRTGRTTTIDLPRVGDEIVLSWTEHTPR